MARVIHLEMGVDGETLARLGAEAANAEVRAERRRRVERELERRRTEGVIAIGQVWVKRIGRTPVTYLLGSTPHIWGDEPRPEPRQIRIARTDTLAVFYWDPGGRGKTLRRIPKTVLRRDWRRA